MIYKLSNSIPIDKKEFNNRNSSLSNSFRDWIKPNQFILTPIKKKPLELALIIKLSSNPNKTNKCINCHDNVTGRTAFTLKPNLLPLCGGINRIVYGVVHGYVTTYSLSKQEGRNKRMRCIHIQPSCARCLTRSCHNVSRR